MASGGVPTAQEFQTLKEYAGRAAAQRPEWVRNLFAATAAFRSAVGNWQSMSYQQALQRYQGEPAVLAQPGTVGPASPGGGGGGGGGGGYPFGTFAPGEVQDFTGYDADGDGVIDTPWPGTDGAGNYVEDFSGGGGGVGGGAGMPAQPQIDWSGADFSSMLGIAGLPADVIAKVTDIFRRIPDAGAAAQVALGYIRGTSWYAQTFVGINFGLQKGLFQDESGYRDYRNALEQVYKQWQGRAPAQNELVSALQEGVSPELVGRRFEGQAIADVNRADIQFLTGNFGASTDLGQQDPRDREGSAGARRRAGRARHSGRARAARRARGGARLGAAATGLPGPGRVAAACTSRLR